MPGRVEVFGGMAVRRLVSATHMPALHTDAQVNPVRMNLQAILAPQRAGLHISHVLWSQVLIRTLIQLL